MNGVLLGNSLAIAALTALAAVGAGMAAALFFMGTCRRVRATLVLLAIVALAMPPFLATNSWIRMFGVAGVWQPGLPVPIYSLAGTVLILALLYWPIAFFLVASAWQKLEAPLLEVEPRARGWALVRWVLLPLAGQNAVTAGIVIFVLALNNFAVPALLQVRVYPAAVWIRFNTHLDVLAALGFSWPLMIAPVLLLMLLIVRRVEVSWPVLEGPVSAERFRRRCGRVWHLASGAVTVVMLVLAVYLPLHSLIFSGRTWAELGPALRAGQGALWNSFVLSALSATFVVGAGWLTWRWRAGSWFWLTFLIPGVLLGLVLIMVFNRPPFLAFYRSSAIVVFAWAARYLAVGWAGVGYAMRSLDQDIVDAGRVDGASGRLLMGRVMLPQIAPGLGASWLIVYLLCLWDVETMLLVTPPGADCVAGMIFGFLHYGHNAQVNALCLLLVGLALVPVILWQVIVRTGLFRTPAVRRWVGIGLLITAAGLAGCGPSASEGGALKSRIFSHVEIIGARGTGLGQFNKPRSLAVDHADNLYVVDMTGRVQKFSADGEFLAYWQFPESELGQPKGMSVDPLGNIVVLEPHYSRVNHFTPKGDLLAQWGSRGTNQGELAFPRAVAVRSDGDIWVSEYGLVERVQRFSAVDHRLAGMIGDHSQGALPFNRPEGLGLDGQDRLYVADSCNHRIQVYDAEGRFIRAYGRPGPGSGELSYPYDVRVDSTGRQYVCEFGNSRIQVFDAEDRPLEVLGNAGAAPGQFNNPWSIALDSHGNLYVADSMNHRVQKLVARRGGGGRP